MKCEVNIVCMYVFLYFTSAIINDDLKIETIIQITTLM